MVSKAADRSSSDKIDTHGQRPLKVVYHAQQGGFRAVAFFGKLT